MKRALGANLSVGQRLFLLTLLPLFVITTLLTSYMVVTRQVDREQVLSDRGKSLVRYLAGTAEFGLFAGDHTALRRLASTMLKQEDVRAVRFFDEQGRLLLATGDELDMPALPGREQQLSITRDDLLWIFQIPVYYAELDVDEFDAGREQGGEQADLLLGWVQLVMDEQRMRIEQQNILTTSLALGGLGFMALFLVAGYVARGISRPISSLTRTVSALESGQLSARATVDAGGELGSLAQGINSLAESVELSSEDLNARVETATRKLTQTLKVLERRNQQLEATREDLIKASAAKGEFLARMSHELRTPLTAVSGYAKLLQGMSLTDAQEEYLKSIIQASAILLSTIDDILDFTRLEAGVVKIEKLPFCLREALEDVLAMHALTAHKKQLELVLFVEPDVPDMIESDALRLRQVVTNLVSNALKFTESGQVVVTASLQSLEEDTAGLVFSVKDSGIGISIDQQAQLFDAFSQADHTIPRRFGGTGLGLAISKELTRLMGGDIRISSQPGQGTEVSFSIRCEIAARQVRDTDNANVTAVAPMGRLYLYDANPWMRRALRSAAVAMADHVTACATWPQLFATLAKSRSAEDVLILGLNREELETAQRDRLLAQVRELFSGPVILLAGIGADAVDELEDDCARFGPLYVRSKPIRMAKFQQVLKLAQSYRDGRRQERAFDHAQLQKSNRLESAIILVAEDNEFNRNLICTIVEAEGGVAVPAKDGVEALRELHARPIHLVLMDLNMPRLDGRLAVQELRRSDAAICHIPVIALTAEVLEGEGHPLIEQGFDQVLFKPLDEERLIGTIVRLLEKSVPQEFAVKDLAHQNRASFLSILPVEMLGEEVMHQLELLKLSHGNQQLQQVRDQAHQLRSVLYGVAGSDEVVACVRNLEQACDAKDSAGVEVSLAQLEWKLRQSLGRQA